MESAHGLGPGKPGPRAAKPITPPYVENNYRNEVKNTFMLIAYLVLLCEFFWEFSIFHFCRPLVDIYWHPLLRRICFWNQAFITLEAYLWNTVSSFQTVLRQPQPLKVKRHDFCVFILDHWSSEEQKRLKLAFTTFYNRLKSGRHSLFPWRMRWICSVMSLLIPRVLI